MATEIINLTADPVQITSGSEMALVTGINGEFRYADSDSKPTDLTAYQSKMELSVNPPFKIWAWSPSTGISICVISRASG